VKKLRIGWLKKIVNGKFMFFSFNFEGLRRDKDRTRMMACAISCFLNGGLKRALSIPLS